MVEKLTLIKNVYSKTQFENTINTEFSQLTTPDTVITDQTTLSVDQFFQAYQNLFFEIPKEGATNSHEYLIQTSQDYVGNTQNDEQLQALIDEINSLREQLVTQQGIITQLSQK
jgi:hypothetical protein